MVVKKFIIFLQEGILAILILLEMYLAVLNCFLDVFGRSHAPAPNAIRSRHISQLGAQVYLGLTSGRGFKCKILINTCQNYRCCMMDDHNVIYIAYNIIVILISVIRSDLSLDP